MPLHDYRYYIPDGAYLPPDASFWDGINYKYWDLPAQYGQVYYFRDFQDWYHYNIYFWNSEQWGELTYKWYWVDDYARQGNTPTWWQQLYYDDYDMSFHWGTDWTFRMEGRTPEWYRPSKNIEMRFLIRSQVFNFKYPYLFQDTISAEKWNAHLIITAPTTRPLSQWDLRHWAVTQMGTPYWTFPKQPHPKKKPYNFIDCSGLVISGRIQDMGVENNDRYRLNHIAVNPHMIQNFYPYPPDPPNENIYLGLTEITEAETGPNDIILVAKTGESFSHVVIINVVTHDDRGRISGGTIIHAWGASGRNNRQVRVDNYLRRYGSSRWRHKFMRFIE